MPVWIDTEAFTQQIKLAQTYKQRNDSSKMITALTQAIHLYRGNFLVDDIYDDWTMELREKYKEQYTYALSTLGEHYFAHHEYQLCVNYQKKLVSIDSCNEVAHRLMMQAYLAQGQRHLALRQYNLCLQALDDELGITPDEKTTKLFESIKNGEPLPAEKPKSFSCRA